jgi:hypothetical protein
VQTRNLNVETRRSINEKKESEKTIIWKLTIKSYMFNKEFGNFHEKKSLSWEFYYVRW